MNYLTESILGNFLVDLYPNYIFEHNKKVPGSNCQYRPDYRNDKLKLIIEFDGYRHYSQSTDIIKDCTKDTIYKNMGYNIIRIPYFVQLSNIVIKKLFDLELNYQQNYPHGFIDEKCLLPCDFNELGIERFKEDLIKFDYIAYEIINSLKIKINLCNDIRLVLPKSLYYLIT